jgi:hypothetical protein
LPGEACRNRNCHQFALHRMSFDRSHRRGRNGLCLSN